MRIDQMHYNFELELDRVASNDRPDFMPWEIDEYLNKAIFEFVKTRYSIANSLKIGFETNQKRIDELSTLHIKSPELQPPLVPIDLGDGRYEVQLRELGRNINGQYFRYLFLTSATVTIRKGTCIKKITYTQWQIDDRKTMLTQPSWKWNRVLANFGRSNFITTPSGNPNVADTMYDVSDLVINETMVTEKYNNEELRSLYFDTTTLAGVSEFTIDDVCINYIKYPNRVFFGGYNHIDKHSTSTTEPIHCDIDDAFHWEIIRLAVDYAQQDIQDQFGVQVSTKKTTEDLQL